MTCIRFRADVAVVSMGTHWFMMVPLRLIGVRVVPNLVNTLWRPNIRLTIAQRIVQWLDRLLFSRCATAILTASGDISAQVTTLTRGKHRPIIEFMPLYRRDLFRQIAAVPGQRKPFRIFFAGRPVVTSAVCPAIRYVGDTVVEVPPNDVRAYGDALLRLSDNESFFRQKLACCAEVQEQFYDPRNSWASALDEVLTACAAQRATVSRRFAAHHP